MTSVRPLTVAYLTGLYARASDSFVRGEVAELRALGHTVHTFSIRTPPEEEVVTDEIRRERELTEDVLAAGLANLCAAFARVAARRPARALRALKLALRIGSPGLRGRLWPLAYLIEAAWLAERLSELGVDHLHDHISEGSAAVAMLAAELGGPAYSFTVHGPGEFDRAPLLALPEKARRALFVVAISDFARSQLLRWIDERDWAKVHVVRCGVHRSFLERPRTAAPVTRQLLCVGRLDEQKGQPLLLEAAAAVAREPGGLELTIVGDGPLRGRLEERIRGLGLEDSVRLRGWAPREELVQLLDGVRALVLASFAEGLPIVVMEALARGRPVIATDVAAMSELVRSGETGWLVAPGSAAALADAMRSALAASSAEIERLGGAGAELVARRHDPAAAARALARLFAGAEA